MAGYRSSRLSKNANRFDNYRELVSKFASVGACGHPISKGEVIGWHRTHGAQCADCWSRWCAENREADMLEARFVMVDTYSSPDW